MIASFSVFLVIFSEILIFFMVARYLALIPEEIARNPLSFFSKAAIALIGFLAPRISFFFFGDAFKRIVLSTLIGLLALALCLRIELAGDVNIFDFSWILTLIRAEGDVGAYSVTFFLSSIILLATWLRAAYHSSNGIELDTLPRFVVIPFALVAILLTISAVSDVGIVTTWAGITYIAIVLLALAGAQLSRSGATLGDFRAGGVATGMLAFTVILTVVLVIFAGFIFEILVDSLAPFFTGPFLDAVWTVFYYALIVPVGWVVINIVDFLLWIFSLLGGGEQESPEIQMPVPVETETNAAETSEQIGESAWNRWGRYAFGGGMLGIAVAIVTIVMVLVMRWYKRRDSRDDDFNSSEKVGSLKDEFKGLTSLFSFRGRGGRKSSDSSGAIKLYLDLLAEASRRGLNRALSQTATEIKPELIEIYNDDFPSQITKLFEEERYGNHPAVHDDLENARVVWEKSQTD